MVDLKRCQRGRNERVIRANDHYATTWTVYS